MPPKRTSSARASHGRNSLSPVPSGLLRSGISPTPHQPSSSPRTVIDGDRSASPARHVPSNAPVVVPAVTVRPIGDMEDVANGGNQKGPHKWVDKPKLSEEEILLRKQAHQQALDALIAEGKTAAEAKKLVQQRERAARRIGETLMSHVVAPVPSSDTNATVQLPLPSDVSKQLLEELNSLGNMAQNRCAKVVRKEPPKNLFTFNSSALLGKNSMEALDSCTAEEISIRLRCPSQPTYGEHFHHSAFIDAPKPAGKLLTFLSVYTIGIAAAVVLSVVVAAYSLRQ